MEQASTLNPSQENTDVNTLASVLQRAATFVVDQSKQAGEYQRQIEELRREIADVKDRVSSALAENQRVRDELYRTVTERDQAKKEAADNKSVAEMYSHDLDETRGRLGNTEQQLRDTQSRLEAEQIHRREAEDDRDYWKRRAITAENARDDVTAKLGKFQATFAEVFKAAQPEVQAKQEEQPKQTEPADSWGSQHNEVKF